MKRVLTHTYVYSLWVAVMLLSFAAGAQDVVIEHQSSAYETSGNDFELTVIAGLDFDDGDGVLCIVSISAPTAQRNINSVQLVDAIGGIGRVDLDCIHGSGGRATIHGPERCATKPLSSVFICGFAAYPP